MGRSDRRKEAAAVFRAGTIGACVSSLERDAAKLEQVPALIIPLQYIEIDRIA
jgi:hypothetical protein